MGTKVIIVYGAVDRLIHRIIKHDYDTDADKVLAGPGEMRTAIVKSTYNTHTSHQSLAISLGLNG